MTVAVDRETFVLPASLWHKHLIALGICSAALLVLFARDLADMVRIWWTSSTFGHCLLVGPIIGWLVWQRRCELAELTPVGWWPGLAIVGAGGVAWWVGDAASAAVLRQFGLVAMLVGATVELFGPRVSRGLVIPIAYAVFLVPFGQGLEAPLQQVTVALVMPMLAWAGLPASADGVMIHAGRYWFEVAEACSGAKFVIAMTAFGVLVAQLGFRSWRRRAVWLAACIVVPILANGVRAFATIFAADRVGVEAAGGFDHIVYGWVFFAMIVAAMLAAAWRWFDKPADEPAFDPMALDGPVAHRLGIVPSSVLVIAIAAVFPAWSALVNGQPSPTPVVALPDVPGWHRVVSGRGAWQPWYPGAVVVGARYADEGGRTVDLAIAAYGRQSEGHELVGYGLGVLRGDDRWLRVGDEAPLAGGSVTRITGPQQLTVASWYRVGETITSEPGRVKLATLRARLSGGSQRAAALHLAGSRDAMASFIVAAGSPGKLLMKNVR